MPQLNQTDREEYDVFTTSTVPTADDDEDSGGPVEVKEQDGKRTLIGYAVVWGAVSDVRRDGFRHRFARGSIRWLPPTLALWAHSLATPLGTTDNATLRIAEDDFGARVEIDLDDTTDADNTYKRVKSRLVRGMSFGGKRIAYDRTADPKVINITSFIADEVSVTIAPGMSETNIVTAENSEQLKMPNQASGVRNTLQKIKLSMLKPRQSIGG